MYARSSTVQGDPQALDDAIDYLRDEVLPAVEKIDGCIGLSTMCDRDSGRCIATTSWRSEEAMHDSEGLVFELRRRFAEILGARTEIREWEIAVLHRRQPAPEAAGARVIWSRWNPGDLDRALDSFRTDVLPRLETLPGFCSVSMLVDRETGRTVTAEVFESRELMFRAATAAKPMREEFTRRMRGEITDLAELDVALAHLRVPETV
jgi:hypothetical protein